MDDETATEEPKYYFAEKMLINATHPYIDLDDINSMYQNTVKEPLVSARSSRIAATVTLPFRLV